jgi:hypothetical protein
MSKEPKNLESLITELGDKPPMVKRVFKPITLVLPWFIIVAAYLAGVIHFLGLRMDIDAALQQTAFQFELGLLGAMALTAAYCAASLSIPDMGGRQWLLAVPLGLLAVFAVLMGWHFTGEDFHMPAHAWNHCFSAALLMCFVPIAALLLLVRTGSTTRPYIMSAMSLLSVSALAWGGMRLSCASGDVGHIFFFHFMPLIMLAIIMSALARRLYRW